MAVSVIYRMVSIGSCMFRWLSQEQSQARHSTAAATAVAATSQSQDISAAWRELYFEFV